MADNEQPASHSYPSASMYPYTIAEIYSNRIQVHLANGNWDAAHLVVDEAARDLPRVDDTSDIDWEEAWVAELERFGVPLEVINILECSGCHLCSLAAEVEEHEIRRFPQLGMKGRRVLYDALIKAGFQPNWMP